MSDELMVVELARLRRQLAGAVLYAREVGRVLKIVAAVVEDEGDPKLIGAVVAADVRHKFRQRRRSPKSGRFS